jgi:hypothetical protein
VIALEYRDGKPVRGYAKVIEDYSFKSLRTIFNLNIDRDAHITTGGWSGYKPIKKKYPYFEQKLSGKGQNFKMLHMQIRNFKNWLRGVISYCCKETLNQYIEEYFFRFNRLNFRQTILEKIICRMVDEKPIAYRSVKYSPLKWVTLIIRLK